MANVNISDNFTPEELLIDEKDIQDIQKTITVSELFNRDVMEYARYTITDRAIPSVEDGLKPVQRKSIWAMYSDKLFNDKFRQKSVNVVGTTMRYFPHGDAGIYGAIVNMASDDYLNYNLINGKGSFGTVKSDNIQPAQARYTEIKLNDFSEELYREINNKSTNMILNYTETLYEPEVFPATLPLILLNYSSGMGLGISSTICPFNMQDVIQNVINIIKNKPTIPMYPDFKTKGQVYTTDEELQSVKNNGRGKFILRGNCEYDEKTNSIYITEIPYNTTFEQIVSTVKNKYNKNKEFQYIKNIEVNTGKGFNGITIELKKDTDIEYIKGELYDKTPLENNLNCNFFVLYKQKPYLWGTDQILTAWIENRREIVLNTKKFELEKIQKELSLLRALIKVSAELDNVIARIKELRGRDVIKYLMDNFSLNEEQSEYVSQIQMKNMNKDFFNNKIKNIEELEKQERKTIKIINDISLVDKIIIEDLFKAYKKFALPRQTEIVDVNSIKNKKKKYINIAEEVEKDMTNYAILTTEHGYVKKMLAVSMRGAEKIMIKDGDSIINDFRVTGESSLYTITDYGLMHIVPISEIPQTKPSELGSYIPRIYDVRMDYDEKPLFAFSMEDDDLEYMENHSLFVGYSDGTIQNTSLSAYNIKSKNATLKNIWDNELYWMDEQVVPVYYRIIDVNKPYYVRANMMGEDGQIKSVIRNITDTYKPRNNRGAKPVLFIDRSDINDKCSFEDVDEDNVDEKYYAQKVTLKRKGTKVS